ncbi:MAG: fused MFS/spermidine synthase [Deltaproteobacteria bacterium]|nr:fused MFS/spermidine synthase [Deltaproteobacteria bacterium]
MFSSQTLKYSLTIFLSAFLLFQIQPMIAKMILPWFGGSAAVWITCMLFFQVVLLAGYVYAHLLISRFGVKGQGAIHSALLLVSLIFLPIAPSLGWKPAGGEEPALRILGLLLTSVGLPYFLLSTTSPLLQAWYAQSARATLPYRLFALSNFASLLGLLAYPFLIEPLASLHQQSLGWSAPYALFVVMGLALSISRLRKKGDGPACDPPVPSAEAAPVPDAAAAAAPAYDATAGDGTPIAPVPTFREKLLWLTLAACASLLLLAVTSHLTQNIASIPFLWILPLGLYLLTFILCFERSGWYQRKVCLFLVVAAAGLMAYGLAAWGPEKNLKIVLPVYCAGLFLCCMFCHGELASRKPAPCHLTSFYLHLSLGTGTLAAYAREFDLFRFYEINPSVEEIARRYFYYLGEAKGRVDVVIGDGRLSLERETPQDYDLLAVDAFSSDSIPVHLLTEQALRLYFRHLKKDGVLAIHISNKHLDLAPVVANLCAKLRKKSLLIDEDRKDHGHVFGSKWVLISSQKDSLDLAEADEGFEEPTPRPDMKIWTDDYSNLYQTWKK